MGAREPNEMTKKLLRQFLFVTEQMEDIMSNVDEKPTLPEMADMERYSVTMNNLMQTIVESKKL